MSLALPGFTDTGQSVSITVSGKARVRMNSAAGAFGGPVGDPFDVPLTRAYFQPPTSEAAWTLGGGQYTASDPDNCPPGSDYIVMYDTYLAGPFAGSPVRLERTELHCLGSIDPEDAPWSAWYTYSLTLGPFRLGMTYELVYEGDPPAPPFAADYRVRYRWFADEDTTALSSMAGHSADLLYYQGGGTWSTSQDVGMTPELYGDGSLVGRLEFGCLPLHNLVEVEFSDLTVDGTLLDTIGLDDGVLRGTGGGAAEGYAPGTGSAWAYPPFRLSYDLDITRNWTERSPATAPDSAGCLVHTQGAGDVTVPYAQDWEWRVVAWDAVNFPGYEQLLIDATWAAGEDPPWRSDDRKVLIWNTPALSDPGANPGTWSPVKLTIEGELEVFRPDASRPSDFVSSDTDDLTVSEGTTETVFHCISPGATATRTFVESWRAHVAAGTGGDLAEFAKYEDTNHEAGDDLWFWGLLTFLHLEWDGSLPSALTLTIAGVDLQMDDTHETGSDRATNSTPTEIPYSYEYEITGTGDYDLCFPTNVDGPVYLSRVDSLTFSGFVAGDYTLTGMKLVANLAAAFVKAFLKCDFGPPVQRDDYSAIGLALGGSHAFGNWGDQAYKPDEVGQVGGNIRFINPVQSASDSGPSGIQDAQWTVEQMWSFFSLLEGCSAVYDVAPFEAANKDAFDSVPGPEIAQCTRPIVPYVKVQQSHGAAPQEEYAVACAWHSGSTVYCNAYPFKCYVRDPRGYGGLEGLIWKEGPDGGERAGDKDIEAYRTDTGAREAGPTTIDGAGYVLLSPVPGRSPTSAVTHDLREAP